MNRYIPLAVVAALLLGACGKKDETRLEFRRLLS